MLISFDKVITIRCIPAPKEWLDICNVSTKSNDMKTRYVFILLGILLLTAVQTKAVTFLGEDPLSLYPNPAVDYLKIDFHSENPLVPEIKFYDLTGKVVKEFDSEFILTQNIFKASLDISDLESGIYFVKVMQGEQVYTKKLVVK